MLIRMKNLIGIKLGSLSVTADSYEAPRLSFQIDFDVDRYGLTFSLTFFGYTILFQIGN